MTIPTLAAIDGNGVLQTINSLPNGGQTTMAGSLPVTFASDQTLPVNAAQETGGNLASIVVSQGAKADTAATDSVSSWSVIALLKGIYARLAGNVNVQPVTSGNVSVTLGTAVNVSGYSSVNVQVDSLSGGDTLVFSASSTQGGTYYPVQVLALSGTFGGISSTVAASGLYSVLGAGLFWIKAVKTGSASTPTITILAGQ